MYSNLKLHLWKTGIRQNRLAHSLNIDEAVLSKIINGFREPTADVRTKIAQFLNADEGWLFERTPDADAAKASASNCGLGARVTPSTSEPR